MNTEELINILTNYHMQEFSSGSELIQALQEDDYARQLVAPAGGIKQQIDNKKDKTICFSLVTDLENTEDNVYDLMRAGRARWRIENETFNTLNTITGWGKRI
jgi:hypothetical protein